MTIGPSAFNKFGLVWFGIVRPTFWPKKVRFTKLQYELGDYSRRFCGESRRSKTNIRLVCYESHSPNKILIVVYGDSIV